MDKDTGPSGSAVSHSTPGSCRICGTGLVWTTRVSKNEVNNIAAISSRARIEGSWQFGTPRTKVLIETCCLIEHGIHVGNRAVIPMGNVRIET